MGGDTEAQRGTAAPKLPCKVRQHPDTVSLEKTLKRLYLISWLLDKSFKKKKKLIKES